MDNSRPPRSICILRLSAIGDTCHVVPLVRQIQQHWPDTRISWIIGRIEARLMSLLPGVEFIIIDKRSRWGGAGTLRKALQGRQFDWLLMLQTSLRSSLMSLLVPARIKLGFDRARARELQWLFSNQRIRARGRQHVLDALLGFAEALELPPSPPRWDMPLPDEALAWARVQIAAGTRCLLISACSSHARRNWSVTRYAEVARYAVRRHGMSVILCGSPSDYERSYARDIEARAGVPLLNLVGKDSLPQLLALLSCATVLLAPDSGPAHMAAMVGTPVIGLYAATRVQRTGPYLSQQWCVDRYAAAAQRFRGCGPDQLKWTEDIEDDGVMDLIDVPAVCERLDAVLAARAV
jgi:heptosyltransferase I